MNHYQKDKKVVKAASLLALAALAYNIVLFVICGFEDHEASFWISYLFMMVAFVSMACSASLIKNYHYQLKDWVFGYPALKHCMIYIVVELILSIIFMALDPLYLPWGLPFSVQFIVLAIHLVFLISCFLAKETIEGVETKVGDAATYIRLLQVDVEMIMEKSPDPEVKAAFQKLAEEVRFSDPMSNPNLFELEKMISQQVNNAESCLMLNDKAGALESCKRASLLLMERNKKCKALK